MEPFMHFVILHTVINRYPKVFQQISPQVLVATPQVAWLIPMPSVVYWTLQDTHCLHGNSHQPRPQVEASKVHR